jgi:hypothetical protein
VTAAEHPGQQGQETGRHVRPDPLAMSPGEKVAAEWEARHDVAARGSRGAPDAVQHYLSESRSHAAQHTGASAAVTGPATQPELPGAPGPTPPRHRRRWWLFGRHG